MSTTTIRVTTETHRVLSSLASERGRSLTDTVDDAAESLRRQQFARRIDTQIGRLRQNPQAWQNYLAESDVTSVSDGIT